MVKEAEALNKKLNWLGVSCDSTPI